MKKLLIAAMLFTAITSCNSAKEKTETPKLDSTVKKDSTPAVSVSDTVKSAIAVANNFPLDFKPTKTFNADKADLHENLKVQELSEKKIAYEISMESGGCNAFTYKGVATLKEGDAESDTDEKGNGYFVAEYIDDKNSNCGVTIRIGGDKGYTNRARFYVYDCPTACKTKNESEPLFSSK